MPFTLAHPAAVLPLRGRGLPMTAMVAGAVAPDAPQLLGAPHERGLTHSPLGVVTLDLALGMVAVVLWYAVYRRPLADIAPDPWRDRLPDLAPVTLGTYLLSVPAVVVGAASHVTWDAFTHKEGWFVERSSAFRASVGGVAVYEILQLACSVAGLAVIVWVVWRHLTSLPARPRRPAPLVGRWALIVVVSLAALLAMLVAALVAPYGVGAVAFYLAVTPIFVLGFGLTCVCAWWQVKRLRRVVSPR